jgi:hypothetical protein
MSRKSVRRAASGVLLAVLFSVVWEWIQQLWPTGPGPVQPACTENCGDAGYGVDPNG